MNRRQFFKQVAATCVAVVMAPTVLVKAKPEKCSASNRAKHIVIANGFDCKAPGCWENYYKDLPQIEKIREMGTTHCTMAWLDFKLFLTEVDRLKYRAKRGL